MNSANRRIEIFAPFGEAWNVTSRVLFQPFRFEKWFVIGFAAWLATFFNGGGLNYRSYQNQDWHFGTLHVGNAYRSADVPPWLWPIIFIGVLAALAIVIVLMWVNARARFMFTDCIVKNRGAIAEPWREYRMEGNRFFVLELLVGLIAIFVAGVIIVMCLLITGTDLSVSNPITAITLGAFGAIAVCCFFFVKILLQLTVAIMYRQRCGAFTALGEACRLVAEEPGAFILFLLFYFVVALASVLVSCATVCVTCCITAIPYIGTVILLPLVMLLFAFPLCFLRQFGDRYDVWKVVPVPPSEPPPAPPIQEINPTPVE